MRIPAGIEDGSRLRVQGEGEPGREGGPRGDLYVQVRVQSDPFFERHEDDLVCKVPVTYAQAVLGGEVQVPTMDGIATLKIPAGTQPNEVLRMRGLGVSDGRQSGDQLVVVQITVPKRVNDRQRELLSELGRIEDEAGEQKSFIDRIKKFFAS